MNAYQFGRCLQSHLLRNSIPPIAALSYITAISEAFHQHDPGAGDADRIPSGRIRLARKPMTRQRRYHYVKRIFSLSSRGSRIREWADDLQRLDDRAWPPVVHDDRHPLLPLSTD